MHIDMQSRQARGIVLLSALWLLASLLIAYDAAEHCTSAFFSEVPRCTTSIQQFVACFVVYASPILAFWALAWVFKANIPFRRKRT